MEKEKIYIDLGKCSEGQRKEIARTINKHGHSITSNANYEIINGCYDELFPLLTYHEYWYCSRYASGKTELTYHEFIKLFEDGEETEVLQVENCISIEELTKLCNDYNRNTLKITNLERDLEYKRSWSKESIAIKEIHKEVSHAQAIKENAKSKLQEIGIVF